MAKVTGPLLSVAAGGQIAKTQVYSSWRGVPYARRYVQPSNPRSTGQTATRSVFSWSSNVWKIAGALFTAPWAAAAKGQPYTDRNLFIGQNTKKLRNQTSLADMIFSPGAGGGLPPTALTITSSSGSMVATTTNPTAPADWTLAGMTAIAIKQENPGTATVYQSYAASATTPFTSATLTPLAAGTYEVGAFLQWTKPDGSTAYSPDIKNVGSAT